MAPHWVPNVVAYSFIQQACSLSNKPNLTQFFVTFFPLSCIIKPFFSVLQLILHTRTRNVLMMLLFRNLAHTCTLPFNNIQVTDKVTDVQVLPKDSLHTFGTEQSCTPTFPLVFYFGLTCSFLHYIL